MAIIFCSLVATGVAGAPVEDDITATTVQSTFDSAAVKSPEPVSHGAGYHLVRIPQYTLQSPIWVLKGIGWLGIEQVYNSRLAQHILASFRVERIWGFYPAIDYGGEEGLAGGLVFHSRDVLTKGERFKIKGTYSTNKYEYFYIKYNLPHWSGYKYDVNVLARYRWRPRERFFGRGPATLSSNEVNYAFRETHFHIDMSHYPIPTLGFGFLLEYTGSKARDGEDPGLSGDLDSLIADPALSLTPASFAESRMAGIGIILNHDWRNHRGQPTQGGFERIDVAYKVGTGRGDDIEYWGIRIEAAQYIDVYMKRVLAFRGLVDWRDRASGSPELPLYQLADLGGLHGLRGFSTNRFNDHAMALGAVEYRWPVWDVVDAFLFVESGRVFDDLSEDFEFKHWEMSYGGGLRIWRQDGLQAYLQVAGSNEGTRLYFSWAEDLDF